MKLNKEYTKKEILKLKKEYLENYPHWEYKEEGDIIELTNKPFIGYIFTKINNTEKYLIEEFMQETSKNEDRRSYKKRMNFPETDGTPVDRNLHRKMVLDNDKRLKKKYNIN